MQREITPVAELTDPRLIWQSILQGLTPTLSGQQKAWLSMTHLVGMLNPNQAVVAAPNTATRDYIERGLRDQIAGALSDHLATPITVAVIVSEDVADPEPAGNSLFPGQPEPALHVATGQSEPRGWADPANRFGDGQDNAEDGADDDEEDENASALATVTEIWPNFGRRDTRPPNPSQTRLNEKYHFESFVIGSSNRFAHAAAVAVSEAPAVAYNPLFIWGDSGLGKTHLLHGIGHYAQRLFPGIRVRYVSSEEFTNDFINSLRDDRKVAFQRRYRDVDVLLVDDIQFLEGKEGTQEEFFHTFNTLYNANKQIVISSDRAPKRLETLEDRLRTRFEWGLTTDIQPPELETRIAILRKKAVIDGLDVPDDVMEFIASRIERNIRELEGALIRVTAYASLNKKPVELKLAQEVLRDVVRDSTSNEIDAATIMGVVSDFYSVSLEDLCGPMKIRAVANARQIAMFLCRELTDLTLPRIGQTFGNRDHTTVMHAAKKIRAEITERQQTYDQIQELTARIRDRARRA